MVVLYSVNIKFTFSLITYDLLQDWVFITICNFLSVLFDVDVEYYELGVSFATLDYFSHDWA